jgi:tetratricopeptide (TPR) repeat protein
MTGMRSCIFLVLSFLAVSGHAAADQRDPRLKALFNQLAVVRTAPEAGLLSAQIAAVWQLSGSATSDLLMERSADAVEAQDFDTGMKLLNAVAEMMPDYAEVYFRRADLLLRMDSPQEAGTDLFKAVRLEPRDFRAHALIGRLADNAGQSAPALAAYRRALELNPMLESVMKRATELAIQEGRKSDL